MISKHKLKHSSKLWKSSWSLSKLYPVIWKTITIRERARCTMGTITGVIPIISIPSCTILLWSSYPWTKGFIWEMSRRCFLALFCAWMRSSFSTIQSVTKQWFAWFPTALWGFCVRTSTQTNKNILSMGSSLGSISKPIRQHHAPEEVTIVRLRLSWKENLHLLPQRLW